MCVLAKAKTINQQTSKGKEEIQRAYERGIKHISMVDMASTRTRKHANKRTRKEKNKQRSKQKMVSTRDNVGLDCMSITSLC